MWLVSQDGTQIWKIGRSHRDLDVNPPIKIGLIVNNEWESLLNEIFPERTINSRSPSPWLQRWIFGIISFESTGKKLIRRRKNLPNQHANGRFKRRELKENLMGLECRWWIHTDVAKTSFGFSKNSITLIASKEYRKQNLFWLSVVKQSHFQMYSIKTPQSTFLYTAPFSIRLCLSRWWRHLPICLLSRGRPMWNRFAVSVKSEPPMKHSPSSSSLFSPLLVYAFKSKQKHFIDAHTYLIPSLITEML